MYAEDRLTTALIKKDGQYVETSMEEALDLVASKMKETIEKHGKDAVAMYTSGQSTIPEGYVASKFMKGAIGTNNLDCNARLCMASFALTRKHRGYDQGAIAFVPDIMPKVLLCVFAFFLVNMRFCISECGKSEHFEVGVYTFTFRILLWGRAYGP